MTGIKNVKVISHNTPENVKIMNPHVEMRSRKEPGAKKIHNVEITGKCTCGSIMTFQLSRQTIKELHQALRETKPEKSHELLARIEVPKLKILDPEKVKQYILTHPDQKLNEKQLEEALKVLQNEDVTPK